MVSYVFISDFITSLLTNLQNIHKNLNQLYLKECKKFLMNKKKNSIESNKLLFLKNEH